MIFFSRSSRVSSTISFSPVVKHITACGVNSIVSMSSQLTTISCPLIFLTTIIHFSRFNLIHVGRARFGQCPWFFEVCRFQFGLGGKYAFFEAHHDQSVLEFSNLCIEFHPGRKLNEPGWKICASGNRERNAAGKARDYFDEAHIASIPLALNVRRSGDLKFLHDFSSESDNFGVLTSDALITDTGTNDQAFSRNDGKDASIEVRQHIDGELRSGKVILNDGVWHVIKKQPELGFIVDRKNVNAAPAKTRFHIDRILDIAELDVTGESGFRRPDSVLLTEQVSRVFIVARRTGLLARCGNSDPKLRKSVENTAENGQFIVDRRNDEVHLFRIADAFDDRDVIMLRDQWNNVMFVSEIEGRR